jgi:adenylylsulfate kinase
VLDSDELRDVLGAHSYAPEDREQFYRALAALAVLIARQGVVALVAATAPRRADRDRARLALTDSRAAPRDDGASGAGEAVFLEVWVDTPLAECEARDPKGLYAQARRDQASQLPGVGVAYEPPVSPEVVAHGGVDDAAVAELVRRLARR